MKKHLLICLAAIAAISLHAQSSADVRQAMQAAAERVTESLSAANLPADQNISVLPFRNDPDRYLEGLLKMAVTRAGLTYVEGREDPFWDVAMKEIEWDDRKSDILDPASLTVFGQLKSSQLLLYGTVREASETGRAVYVELELHLSSIATKQHLWGDLVAIRYYKPGMVTGIVDLPVALRRLLQDAISKEAAAIKSSPKLAGVDRVAIAPIAGDIDGYIGTLAENLLSATQLTPTRVDAVTVGEIRQILRDRPNVAGAVLTGAVRDLSRTLEREEPTRRIFELNAEVQLRIESAADGSVLWSQTISATGEDVDEDSVWTFLGANRNTLLIIGGVLLGLILLSMFFGAMRRSR